MVELREIKQQRVFFICTIDYFTVLCSVSWFLNGSGAGVDLALFDTDFTVFVTEMP